MTSKICLKILSKFTIQILFCKMAATSLSVVLDTVGSYLRKSLKFKIPLRWTFNDYDGSANREKSVPTPRESESEKIVPEEKKLEKAAFSFSPVILRWHYDNQLSAVAARNEALSYDVLGRKKEEEKKRRCDSFCK